MIVSATALRWLNQLRVEDGTLLLILRALADAADTAGRCIVAQSNIARQTGVNEKTVRRSIAVLDAAGILARDHRSSGKNGRLPDEIMLAISREFDLNKRAVADLRRVGATGHKVPIAPMGATGLSEWVQPGNLSVAPTASRAEHRIYTSPDRSKTRVSGRVWLDRQRQAFRAAVRLNGVDMTLGRFATELEARRALEGALADIEHAALNPAGTPRHRKHDPRVEALDGVELTDFLFGSKPALKGSR